MKKKKKDITMFEFVKKSFFTGLTFSLTLTSVNPLKYVSIKNAKYDLELLVLFYFILLVSKQVDAVLVTTISMISLQTCVFMMLLKT